MNENVGHIGDQCIWIDNASIDEPYDAELFSKQFDLSSYTDTVWVSFWYSYAQKHESNDDRLRFYTSNNCGATFQLKEQLRGTQDLNTISYTQIDDFVPESYQWSLFSYPITNNNLLNRGLSN